MFKLLPNIKSTLNYLKKINKILLNWRNFAKSGHTGILPNGADSGELPLEQIAKPT